MWQTATLSQTQNQHQQEITKGYKHFHITLLCRNNFGWFSFWERQSVVKFTRVGIIVSMMERRLRYFQHEIIRNIEFFKKINLLKIELLPTKTLTLGQFWQ